MSQALSMHTTRFAPSHLRRPDTPWVCKVCLGTRNPYPVTLCRTKGVSAPPKTSGKLELSSECKTFCALDSGHYGGQKTSCTRQRVQVYRMFLEVCGRPAVLSGHPRLGAPFRGVRSEGSTSSITPVLGKIVSINGTDNLFSPEALVAPSVLRK